MISHSTVPVCDLKYVPVPTGSLFALIFSLVSIFFFIAEPNKIEGSLLLGRSSADEKLLRV